MGAVICEAHVRHNTEPFSAGGTRKRVAELPMSEMNGLDSVLSKNSIRFLAGIRIGARDTVLPENVISARFTDS
jgi:hypothetical protein